MQMQGQEEKSVARRRVEQLFDPGIFFEIDPFAQSECKDFNMEKKAVPGDGVVTGFGGIDGRRVCVYAQDPTVLGGSVGHAQAEKTRRILDLARDMKIPVVSLQESPGARIQEGIESIKGYSSIFYGNILCSGVVPQISAILGTCAGGAVYSPALMDFIFMIEGRSHMFITGPPTIESVTGEKVDKEGLGGTRIHGRVSGVADFICKSESECFQSIRKLLGLLPSSNEEAPPFVNLDDDPMREEEELESVIPDDPKKAYDMKRIIRYVVDQGDFFEVKALFAPNIITGFSRLNGRTIGIVANQPYHLAGAIDIDASVKAARFIRFCDCFNIPIITFADTPAYLPGTKQEHGGIIRHGAKMLYAYGEATVPKITIVTRKWYGGGNPAMCNKEIGADFVFAWPSAEIGVLGAEAAVEVLLRREIQSTSNPEEFRELKIREYRDVFANPLHAAKKRYLDGIIEPRQTRSVLVKLLGLLEGKRQINQYRKHGNSPL